MSAANTPWRLWLVGLLIGAGACHHSADPYEGIPAEQLTARLLSIRPDSVKGEWGPTKILQYEWMRGAQPYLLIREDPTTQDTAEWFGARLRIRRAGQEDVLIVDSIGWGLFHTESLAMDSTPFAPLLVKGENVYLLPSVYGRGGSPTLGVIGYQFGSSPGSFRLLTVAPGGRAVVVMHETTFEPEEVTDLDRDGVFELVGRRAWGEGMSNPNARGCSLGTYAPFSVFRFRGDSVPMAVEDLELSRRYNQEHYVWYGGADPNDALVQWCPGDKYRLTRTND